MSRKVGFSIAIVILAIFLFLSSVFVVNQKEYALVFKFGQWQRTVIEPGMHFKLPTPVEKVVFLDKRIQSIESGDTERIQTSEKKNLIIDSYIKWRISDPLQFVISFGADAEGAQGRLTAQIRDALNASVNTRTVKEVVSLERDTIMSEVLENISARAKPLGIEVVDVRLKRIEFSEEVSDSVYSRMRAERKQEANRLRANGQAASETIRAEADRNVQKILAEAAAKSEAVRGEGDAKATELYASAYGSDLDFYRFYGTLKAYRESFQDSSDVLVLDPNSEFLRFFKKSSLTQ